MNNGATNEPARNGTQRRREAILEQLLAQGHVLVRDLSARLGVSEATVRRDLRALAPRHRLELVYGGATLPQAGSYSIEARAHRNIEAKRIIGKLAADLVKDGDMLFVDAGTTSFEMRHRLAQKRGLTVVVNSTRLATALAGSSDSSVVLLGGHFRPERMDPCGPLAVDAIDRLRGYLAFIGADGLSRDFGVSAVDLETADLYRRVMGHARETILLADHTKFDRPSLYRIADFDAIRCVVTDRPPAPEWRAFFADVGIDVRFPETSN
ncbi:MAG: DeoR/GlpR transcriptional regulator [Fimbriimonadaceae bacterium]|nr:DeoR/GlpR transcriptional regulator [Fimbriimonadaceae bacterium]